MVRSSTKDSTIVEACGLGHTEDDDTIPFLPASSACFHIAVKLGCFPNWSTVTSHVYHHAQVITVEPGCYFVEATLAPALRDPDLSRFFVMEEIEKLRGSGGVRIEDDVVRNYSPPQPAAVLLYNTMLAEFLATHPRLLTDLLQDRKGAGAPSWATPRLSKFFCPPCATVSDPKPPQRSRLQPGFLNPG